MHTARQQLQLRELFQQEIMKDDHDDSLEEIKVENAAASSRYHSDWTSSKQSMQDRVRLRFNEEAQHCTVSASGGSAKVLPVMFSPVNMASRRLVQKQREGITGTGYALEGLRFISKASWRCNKQLWWDSIEKCFHKLASPEGILSRDDFASCIGMEDSQAFAGELLDALARRKGKGSVENISLDSLRVYWSEITDDSFHSRAQIFFSLCDKDSDGRIAEREVKEMIMLSASSNKLSILEEQAEEYASLIMQELDVDKHGYIELSQLEDLFQSLTEGFSKDHKEINAHRVTANSDMLWIAQRVVRRIQGSIRDITFCSYRVIYFCLDNWKRIWVLMVWVLTMVALFLWKFFQYKQRTDFQVMGYCVCTAKGAAETLKLNMALILLPVCRNSLTWLQSTFLISAVPFHDNINFHKIIARGIAVGICVHAGSHLFCDFPRIANANSHIFMDTIASDFGNRQPSVLEIILTLVVITGIIMTGLMVIAYLLANHWFRRNIVKLPWPFHRLTGFNAFWYSHHLFLIVYVFLFIHSFFLFLTHDWTQKTTWIYVSMPLILYMGERFLRMFRSQQYKVNTLKVAIHAGDVLALYITKPQGFKYESGMYIFLQCPAISPFEWHPFSITSAPSDEYLSVHIRALGDWTREMKKTFQEALECSEKKNCENNLFEHDSCFPKLFIDGPYGAPAQDHKKYEVMLLVGVGIGATPFISVVRDVLNSIKSSEKDSVDSSIGKNSTLVESNDDDYAYYTCLLSPLSGSSPSPRRLRKRCRRPAQAYFYWITREQRSFEWFKGIMNEVAETDQKAVIELHNYLTSVYEEGDARSALISLVQTLHHAKNGVDILSGTRVWTHFARPNWFKVFSRISANHPGARIGVFYCGPSVLAKELNGLSKQFSQTSSTKFHFHKENF